MVAVVAGLLPSLQAFRGDLSAALRISPLNAGGHTSRAGRVLIVAQTAMTLALLAGAGLVVRSLANLDRVTLGFRDDAFAVQVQLPALRYPNEESRVQFVDRITSMLSGPDVLIGAISELPLSGSANSSSLYVEGRVVPREEKQPHAETWSAAPKYFEAIGIALRQGRFFDETDVGGRPAVAIISESFAQRYFPGENPLGKRVDFEGSDRAHRWREIVGVVGDVRDRRIERTPEPQLYAPYAQRSTGGVFLVVRGGSPLGALPAIRAAVHDVDAALPIYNPTTLAMLRDKDTRDRRVAGTALAGFAAGALFVAALGLYGLVAQSVRQRVREIGVRVAVGASPTSVLRLFLAEGGRLMLWGVLAGIALAVPSTRVLSTLVFGVTTTDPVTYAIVATILLVVGVATAAVPAWRAARIDPTEALRVT